MVEEPDSRETGERINVSLDVAVGQANGKKKDGSEKPQQDAYYVSPNNSVSQKPKYVVADGSGSYERAAEAAEITSQEPEANSSVMDDMVSANTKIVALNEEGLVSLCAATMIQFSPSNNRDYVQLEGAHVGDTRCFQTVLKPDGWEVTQLTEDDRVYAPNGSSALSKVVGYDADLEPTPFKQNVLKGSFVFLASDGFDKTSIDLKSELGSIAARVTDTETNLKTEVDELMVREEVVNSRDNVTLLAIHIPKE